MPKSRYKFVDNDAPYFLTAAVVNWLPLFGNPAVVQMLLDSLKFLQDNGRLTLHAYVIMENHIHLIVSSSDLSKQIGNFKSFSARQIIDLYKIRQTQAILDQLAFHKRPYKKDRDYQFWQEGSHPQRIQGDVMLRQKIRYIHDNPVKRGWVDEPTDWRYSSARNYAGMPGLLDVKVVW